MLTGDIATWGIFAVIMVAFLFGVKRIYHNFSSGKCDSCSTSSCCSGACHGGCSTVVKNAAIKVKSK